MITCKSVAEALQQGVDDYYSSHPYDPYFELWLEGRVMSKSTKLEYVEYKALEGYLYPGFWEVKEETADKMAYRKTIVLNLAGRELRFIGPWKHEYTEIDDRLSPGNTPGQGT